MSNNNSKFIKVVDAAAKVLTVKEQMVKDLADAKERLKRSEQRYEQLKQQSPTDFFRIRQASDIVKAGRAVVSLYEEQMRTMESSKSN